MLKRLPSVIAIPLAEYFREVHPVLRLHRLGDAVEVLTKFLAVAADMLNVIEFSNRRVELSPDDSPCLSLPDEAWKEPRLLLECPLCKKPLRFNPFIVDNRDRY